MKRTKRTKRTKRIFSIVISTLLAANLTSGVFAEKASITVDDLVLDPATKMLTISGNLGSGEKDKEIFLRFLNYGKTLETALTDDTTFYKIDQMTSSDGGEFEFVFPINSGDSDFVSGDRLFYIDCDGHNQYSDSIYIASDADIGIAYAAVKEALQNNLNLERELSSNAEVLAINTALYNSVTVGSVAVILQDMYNKDATCVDTLSKLKSCVQTAALLSAYNEGKISVVVSGTEFLYEDLLKIDRLDVTKNVNVYEYYTGMSDSEKTTIISGLMGKNYKTLEELYKTFATLVVTNGISDSTVSGWAHVRSLLTNNAAYIGLDLTSYNTLSGNNKNFVDNTLTTKRFGGDITVLQREINSAIQALSQQNNGNGGSPGGAQESFGGGIVSLGNVSQNNTEIFTDLSNHLWAKDAILNLYSEGIIVGVGENKFNPAGKTTREQFVKMLTLTLGIQPDYSEENSFKDVLSGAWYTPYILAAKKAGITTGKDDGTFGVGEYITRQDAAVMLKRVLEGRISISSEVQTEFTDAESISAYAKDAVKEMNRAGIISGDDTGTFRPHDLCTRAEVATMLFRVMGLL